MITLKFLTITLIVAYFLVFGLGAVVLFLIGGIALDSQHSDISGKHFLIWLVLLVFCCAMVAFGIDMMNYFQPQLKEMFAS